MKEPNNLPATIEALRSAAAAITDAADWLAQQCDEPPEVPEPLEVPEKPPLEFADVRAVLAEKSSAGHTSEVKKLIKQYGAAKLSEVDPKHYEELLRKVELL